MRLRKKMKCGGFDRFEKDKKKLIREGFDTRKIDPRYFDMTSLGYELHDIAFEKMHEKDVPGLLALFGNNKALDFFFDNAHAFYMYGIYEQALLLAYSAAKTTLHDLDIEYLLCAFNAGDQRQFDKHSDKHEYTYPLDVYRGICGEEDKLRPRGISWTANFDLAKWFATNAGGAVWVKLINCKVFKTTITKSNVFAYINDREEEEFICYIPEEQEIEEVWSRDTA